MTNHASHHRLQQIPTPIAGLALGLASLGWCWESFVAAEGLAQLAAALVSGLILLLVGAKFLLHPRLLHSELQHPVVGSVIPTFAMATMVISKAVGLGAPRLGEALWLLAVGLHLTFLLVFVWHRLRRFALHQMVPAWFVPPVGIIVADVSFPGDPGLLPLALGLLYFGLLAYAVMLPAMLYRLIFAERVPDAAKPTIAIMAAPASLSLAGYLTVSPDPAPMLVALLASIAVLMTVLIYVAFFSLLRLPFSPGYAAFTFPMVIGVTALVKTGHWLAANGGSPQQLLIVRSLSELELLVATAVVGYVALCYLRHLLPVLWPSRNQALG